VADTTSARPSSRAEGKAWTRERVLSSARRVFAERGYEGASVTEIAKAADVAVGSVYLHFATKLDLFWAVVNQRLDTEERTACAALTSDPVRFVERYNERLVESAEERGEVALQAEMWLHALRDEEFRGQMATRQRQVREMVARLVGQLRDAEAEWLLSDDEISLVAMSLFRGLVQARCVDVDGVPERLFGDCIMRLLTARADATTASR
jgi:AcrR family transcriptional regulator